MTLRSILRILAGSCVFLGAVLLRIYGQKHGWPLWVSLPVFVGMILAGIGLLSWEKPEKRPPGTP